MFGRVVDTSSMLVAASVNQTDVESLRINAKATLRFDAYPDLVLSAHVVSIGAIASTGGFRANYVKEIPVYLKLDQIDQRVIPDLTVSVDVVVDSSDDSVLVPLETVFADGAGKHFVYVKTADGFQKREVEIGLRNHVKAVVKSGVRDGEVLAVDRPAETAQPKGTAGLRRFRRQGEMDV
jgi:multidrug efflux pump subunit AcrA (membrane-fusion protein)